VTAVHDVIVLKIAFDVVLTLTQLYPFLTTNYPVVLHILRVLFSFFIASVRRSGKDDITFVVNDQITLDSLSLETILFWSVIHVLEKGEVRRLLTSDASYVSEQIGDFLYVLLPQCYQALYLGNPTPFAPITLPISTYFASALPFCDCSDLWLAAFSRKSPFEFLNTVLIAGFVLGVKTGNKPSVDIIEDSFHQHNANYVLSAAFRLHNLYRDLLAEGVAKRASGTV
jgi:hypothetical protein